MINGLRRVIGSEQATLEGACTIGTGRKADESEASQANKKTKAMARIILEHLATQLPWT